MSREDVSPIKDSHKARAWTCRHCGYQCASVFRCMCGCNTDPPALCPECGCPSAEPLNL